MTSIEIVTHDGICPAYVARPDRNGPWHAVLIYMDGVGIRRAMLEVAERIAERGYFALLPDLFYRSGPYAPMNAKTVFSDPVERKVLFEKYLSLATQANIMSDTRAFLDYLATEPDVKPGGIATVGYCFGGQLSIAAAGHYADHIVAAASYHGARLATDAPESPHLLAPKMKARLYVGGASEDASFDDAAKARLETALTAAGVEHRIETYTAKHGWVLRDTPAYDRAASERHYETLFRLLREAFEA